MKLSDIFRLIRTHIVLLLIVPLLLVTLVTYLTRHPTYVFSSETTLYTGIASGGSVDMNQGFNFFATNTAFDNLINVVKARETQEMVGIHLLAQHLMMNQYDAKFISKQSFLDLQRITPAYIRNLVVKKNASPSQQKPEQEAVDVDPGDTITDTISQPKFSFSSLDTAGGQEYLPSYVDAQSYEQTVKNLISIMTSDDTNFVYKLLNFNNPHYSIKSISRVGVQRITSSDLVQLKYESDDPGICQQTLVFMTKMCIKNYKIIKENRSDAVVKYFEYQVKQAALRLKGGEDKLLKFNEDNNIINYYEQSKAIAVVKEDLDVNYHNKRIKIAGLEAAIKRIEEKLGVQKKVQLQSADIIEKRNQLASVNSRIADMETIGYNDSIDSEEFGRLKLKSERIKDELRSSVVTLSSYSSTIEGLPISTLLNDWLTNVIEFEDTKAGLVILGDRIKEFQKQYAIYAPAGANLKRIEREISVSEQEFLELLHGLNLAKLKMQDIELSSNIKAVDAPYFPLSPNPTKRKMLIMLAALFGFLLVFSILLALEYFDNTLGNLKKATRIIGLNHAGVFPKILVKTGSVNFLFITNRCIELIIQKIEFILKSREQKTETKTILFFSSLSNEGKTVLMVNIANKLLKQGKKVVLLSFSRESLQNNEVIQIGYPTDPIVKSKSGTYNSKRSRMSVFSWLIGYSDKRIDHSSAFLQNADKVLSGFESFEYQVNEQFFNLKDSKELLERNNIVLKDTPDYLLLELPPVLYYTYPNDLVNMADLAVLVCRSNRIWSEADCSVLDNFKQIHSHDPVYILNGVELAVLKSVLGELPAKVSFVKRLIKKIFHFQINNRQQI